VSRTTHVAAAAGALLATALSIPASRTAEPASDPGRAVFAKVAQPPCTTCHTLQDAGSTAEIGPDLDELKADRARIERAVRDGLNAMPPYADQLTPEQIAAVAAYVTRVAGKPK
jgi:mono/diheme cytochrome c family protein